MIRRTALKVELKGESNMSFDPGMDEYYAHGGPPISTFLYVVQGS
jgi:hypothetical protein